MTAVRGAPRPGLAEMPLLPPGFMPYDGTTAQGPEPIEHKGSLSDLTRWKPTRRTYRRVKGAARA